MESLKDTLYEIESKLPPLATAKELVQCGIFPCIATLNRFRQKGIGPGYIQMSPRIFRYPRESIIKYLKEHHISRD